MFCLGRADSSSREECMRIQNEKCAFQVATVRTQGKRRVFLHEERRNGVKKGDAEVTLAKSSKSIRDVQVAPGRGDAVLRHRALNQPGNVSRTACTSS